MTGWQADSERSGRERARWMAERANVRTCSGASFWAWGGRAQSAVREMNDSRYYQPLLLTSTIDDASATTPGYPPTRPASQPALSILSPPPSPPPPPPPLPDAASPTTQARERESVRACESDTRRNHNTSHAAARSIAPSFTCLTTAAPGPAATEGVVRDWSRCCPRTSSQHLQPTSILPANKPADRE